MHTNTSRKEVNQVLLYFIPLESHINTWLSFYLRNWFHHFLSLFHLPACRSLPFLSLSTVILHFLWYGYALIYLFVRISRELQIIKDWKISSYMENRRLKKHVDFLMTGYFNKSFFSLSLSFFGLGVFIELISHSHESWNTHNSQIKNIAVHTTLSLSDKKKLEEKWLQNVCGKNWACLLKKGILPVFPWVESSLV